MRLSKTLLTAGLLALGLDGNTAFAQQQVAPHDRQALTFYFQTTPLQETALDKYAHADLAKALQAGHPVEPRVSLLPGMIVISLESVSICDRKRGCPLLVFRDITKKPTLQDYSYQNVSITERPKGTYLFLRDEIGNKECLIPRAGTGRCTRPTKPKP